MKRTFSRVFSDDYQFECIDRLSDRTERLKPTGKKTIAFIGDSVTGNTQDGAPDAPKPRLRAHGYIPWAMMFSGYKLHFPHQWNFGKGGDNSSQVLARINSVVDVLPDYCVVETGGVDGKLGYTVEQTTDNLSKIYDILEERDITIIAVTMYPNQTPNTYSRQHILNVNKWVRQQALSRKGFYVVEGAAIFTDFGTKDARVDYVSDGTHPSVNGAAFLGKALADLILSIEGAPASLPVADPSDNFDDVGNPTGNILTNIGFVTTSGGSVTGNATGTVPSGWAVGTTGGVTASCSVVNDPTSLGLKQLEITFGGTGLSSAAIAYAYVGCFVPTKNTTKAGRVYQHSVDIEVVGGSNLSGVSLQVMPEESHTKTPTTSFLEATSFTSSSTYATSNFLAMPNYKGRLITPPEIVTTSNQGVYFCIKIHTLSNKTFGGKVIIKNPMSCPV